MRHSRLYGIMAGMLSGMLVLSVSSCVKDDFDRNQNASDALSFEVEVSGGWSEAAAASSTSIRRMSQSTDAEPLYLVTQVSDSAPVSAESGVVTRGTPVETAGPLETGGFGLSAICYTGTWPEGEGSTNNWTTNFAHNLNVTMQDGHWKAPEKLEWPGSGNIRFFAYYPYSANSNGCIAHSGTDVTGSPVLTYTVPDDVKNQPDLLWAVTNHSGKSDAGGTVNLKFQHALTAVTIKTGTDMLSGTITGVKISGVYGQGSCAIGGADWTPSETRDFEIKDLSVKLSKKMDENGIGINTTPGETVTGGELTFMMVPQTLPKDAKLTINFTDDLTNTPRTLTADISDTSWPAGKKVAYSINSRGIVIEPVLELKVNRDGQLPGGGMKLADFEKIIDINRNGANSMYDGNLPEGFEQSYLPVSGYLHDVDITAYVKVTQLQAEEEEAREKYIELSFVIEYSEDNGTTWKSPTEADGYGWIPETAESREAADLTSAKNGAISLPAQSQFTELQKYFRENGYSGGHVWLNNIGTTGRKTVTDEGKGSKDAPYDLVAENPIKKESANCYIINDHGYYMFPVCYGNTYGTGEKAYTATSSTIELNGIPQSNYQLIDFVGHDDKPITSSGTIVNDAVWIRDVYDAVIIWQDSPDLVEKVQLITRDGQKWISFHTARQALSQGNAVIAVRNAEGTILWSWHIWATHYNWQEQGAMIPTGYNREDGQTYNLTPCNLGYSEPHGANDERNISIRFKVMLPDGSTEVISPEITGNGCPSPGSDHVITFNQFAIAESVAGDNTYYQWGRKDPMLPGVYSKTMYEYGVNFFKTHPLGPESNPIHATHNELTMNNKVFYSTAKYRFYTQDTGKSIGYTIENPHLFLIHKRPENDAQSPIEAQLRGHWHNGELASYKKHSLMNFWNSELMQSNSEAKITHPNGIYVQKTIYDPCPAGFKIPSPNAYVWLFIKDGNFDKGDNNGYKYFFHTNSDYVIHGERVANGGQKIGWILPINNGGGQIFFPATGVRNVGLKRREWDWGTTPAFADLTFIASAGFIDDPNNNKYSCCLFSIDDRVGGSVTDERKTRIKTSYPTYNSYGFTLRPVLDKDR